MGERKVLNKYFPPDFDPAKLPKGKRRETNEMKVRMMLPMSVRCKTCGTFMYKGTKFNTRKEDVMGENYLGIQIFRFYYRCKKCAAEFCMKTDPKNADYVLEAGATRNYEPWRDEEATKAEAVAKREEEEMGNAMKALENRTLDSKREMDIMAALDEMKALNAQHAKVTTEQALAALQKAAAQQQLEDDDAIDVAEFYQLRAQASTRRLGDDDEDESSEEAATAPTRVGREDGAAGSSAGARSTVAGSTSLAAGAAAAELSTLQQQQQQQQVDAKVGGLRAAPPPRPAIKVTVKPKASAPQTGPEPQGGEGGDGAGQGKRPAPDAADTDVGAASKRQNVETPSQPSPGGLTGLLGQYGSSGSDSES